MAEIPQIPPNPPNPPKSPPNPPPNPPKCSENAAKTARSESTKNGEFRIEFRRFSAPGTSRQSERRECRSRRNCATRLRWAEGSSANEGAPKNAALGTEIAILTASLIKITTLIPETVEAPQTTRRPPRPRPMDPRDCRPHPCGRVDGRAALVRRVDERRGVSAGFNAIFDLESRGEARRGPAGEGSYLSRIVPPLPPFSALEVATFNCRPPRSTSF